MSRVPMALILAAWIVVFPLTFMALDALHRGIVLIMLVTSLMWAAWMRWESRR